MRAVREFEFEDWDVSVAVQLVADCGCDGFAFEVVEHVVLLVMVSGDFLGCNRNRGDDIPLIVGDLKESKVEASADSEPWVT